MRATLVVTMSPCRQRVAHTCLLITLSLGCSGTSLNPSSSTSGGASSAAGNSGMTASSGSVVTTGGQTNNQGGTLNRGGNATGGAVITGGTSSQGGAATGGSIAAGGTSSQGGAATGGSIAAGGMGKSGNISGGSSTTGGVASAGASATPGCIGSGWKLVWSDEFNGASGSAVDATNWANDLGNGSNGWGNSELEYYTNSTNNAALDGNGNLAITAQKEAIGGLAYTSARLKTQGLHAWQYGRIEGRMKIPVGQGIWPAFWMLGNDIATNSWPACGELDIMENIGKEPNIIHASLHGPGYSGGSPLTAQTTLAAAVGLAFHVFAVEWDATSVRWYVDNTLYSTKTTADVPSGGTWVYTHPFFIILNVAVGGTWPGSPDTTTVFPQQLLVDYVRVCQK